MQKKHALIDEYSKRLKKIEEQIASVLPQKPDYNWVREASGSKTDVFNDIPLNFFENINSPGADLVARGGKRWRPMLMLLFSELAGAAGGSVSGSSAVEGGSAEGVLELTPLVELPHTGSLIIDDIEDSADFRRGKPAVHLIYGTDISINSGNLLYFLPSMIIDNSGFDDKIKLLLYRLYSESMRRLHIGQGLDIQWHRDHSCFPSEAQYLLMCRCKTGALSRFAAEAGILCAGGRPEDAAAAGEACELMGAGFQIMDDVLNLRKGNPGKRRGDDIVEGKKSLPVILYAMGGGDTEQLARLFKKAGESGIDAGSDAVEEAILLLEKSGSVEKAEKTALNILNNSKKEITGRFENSTALELIGFMFDSFI